MKFAMISERLSIVLLVPRKRPNKILPLNPEGNRHSKFHSGSQRMGAIDKTPSLKHCEILVLFFLFEEEKCG